MRRRLLVLIALVLALSVAIAAGGVEERANRASTFQHRSRGLLAAYTYLERSGVATRRWQRPLDELEPEEATLVIALPVALSLGEGEYAALERWRLVGGAVLLLADPAAPDGAARGVLGALGLRAEARPDPPPLWWPEWKAWASRELALSPADPALPGPVRILAGSHRTRPLGEAAPLYLDPGGEAAIYRLEERGRGPVVVVDNATALGNRWLAEAPQNLALLEALAGSLPGPLIFDEWHQGYSAAPPLDGAVLGPARLALAHLLLLYLAAVWTLSRPFGPDLQVVALRRGSVARDLEALASLHRAGGHAAEAGQRLLELARERAGHRARELGLPERFEGGDEALVALARRVGALQAERKL